MTSHVTAPSAYCVLSQVFEKLIFDSLYLFVKDNLHSSQFGFRKHQSTVLQLLIFLDKIYKTMDSETGKHWQSYILISLRPSIKSVMKDSTKSLLVLVLEETFLSYFIPISQTGDNSYRLTQLGHP